MIESIKNSDFDVEDIVTQKWRNISVLSKKSFLWIFIITNIVFLFHTVTFFWGNHDWTLIKNGFGITNDMLKLGRFTSGALQQLMGGDILPIANNLFCFAGFTLAAIYLAKYWKIPQTPITYIMFGLFVIITPYTLPWLWYTKQTTLFWNILFCVLALILSEKYSLIKSIIAISLITFNLGTYASLISTLLIMLLGRILIDIMYEEKSLKMLINSYTNSIINIVIGSVLFLIVLLWLKYTGKMGQGQANTDFISITDLKQKISYLIHIKSIFYTATPYISSKLMFLMTLPVFGVFYIAIKKHVFLKTLIGILLLFICSQMTNLLAKENFNHYTRVEFFSYPFLFAAFIAGCLKYTKSVKSLTIILLTVIIYSCALSDFRFQRVNYLGKMAEMEQYQDIKARIKSNKAFRNKEYILISVGANTKRPLFYHYNKSKGYAGDILKHGTIRNWNETEYYNFSEEKPFIKKSFLLSSKRFMPKDIKTLTEISNFIFQKAKPYPYENSVYIDNKYIYIIYNEQGLKQAKENLREMLKKKGVQYE